MNDIMSSAFTTRDSDWFNFVREMSGQFGEHHPGHATLGHNQRNHRRQLGNLLQNLQFRGRHRSTHTKILINVNKPICLLLFRHYPTFGTGVSLAFLLLLLLILFLFLFLSFLFPFSLFSNIFLFLKKTKKS